MAYVSVPKDLTKVKNKLVFNLTRRQLICFALAAAIGLPFYFLTREALGTTTSATCMVLLMCCPHSSSPCMNATACRWRRC